MKNGDIVYFLFFLICLFGCSQRDAVNVVNMRLNMKKDPIGIQSEFPRFSWQLHSSLTDVQQVSYCIQVAETPVLLREEKDLTWNTGEVSASQSVSIVYDGKPLQSGKSYFWRVKVHTNKGNTSWSDVGEWTMTMLDSAEWKASWIGEVGATNPGENLGGKDADPKTRLAARYLRKDFKIDKSVKKATLYISGLGTNRTYLNGKPITKDVLSPTVALYPERVYYNVYDVTDKLRNAGNTLGVILGNGRYFSMRIPGMKSFDLPALLAQLSIQYTDGSVETIISDTSWSVTSKGPIVANNEFDGEEYDARLELSGWNQYGYDDSAWKKAELMEVPKGQLTAQPNPNIRVQEELYPIAIYPRPDGKYLLDMGQNMVGWLAVSLKGKAGKPVSMRFAELLQPDSSLYLANLRTARVTDIYTPAVDGDFIWEPEFVYHGFRFVEIDGLDYMPDISNFKGRVVYDLMQTTGSFASSDSILNKIYKNAYWGIRGNYRGMPTDCPQRDERLGWLGDRATGAYGEAFLFNNELLYAKWLQDIEDSMSPDGSISDVSPSYWTIWSDDVTWPSAFFYVADMLYKQYGNTEAICKHYPAMKKWMARIEEVSMKDYILTKDTYGDWCMPPESLDLIHSKDPARKTDGAILSTTVYYDLLNKMAQFAVVCGDTAAIPEYRILADRIKKAYNDKFFNAETVAYGNNTVTANLLSLRLGLVSENHRKAVFDNIVSKTENEFNGHVSTGVLGIQHLMRGLTENGRVDLAKKIATNQTYPSWGYMINNGATTIWELWNGNTADPAMNSANHVMLLGDLLIWYYEDLAGIRCASNAVGYQKLEMAPVFPEGLDSVSATYESVYGLISSAWTQKNGKLNWQISLPANTSAIVRIPARYTVQTGSQPGIRSVTTTPEEFLIEVGSGNYQFAN